MAKETLRNLHRQNLIDLQSKLPNVAQINEYECRFRDFSNRYSWSQLFIQAIKKYGAQEAHHTLTIQINQADELGNHPYQNHLLTIVGIEAIRNFCLTGRVSPLHTIHSTKNSPRLMDWQDMLLLNYNIKQGAAIETQPFENINVDFINIIKSSSSVKLYRYKKRYRFRTTQGHFLDLTLVKQASGNTPSQSEFTNADENFEVELEFNNEIESEIPGYFPEALIEVMQMSNEGWTKVISEVTQQVTKSFRSLVFMSLDGPRDLTKPANGDDFITADLVPFEINRIIEDNHRRAPIDQIPYLVTDKADGTHHILFIDDDGNMYMIDSNFKIKDCEIKATQEWAATLLDGELVNRTDNKGQIFLGFDILFAKGEDVRTKPFQGGRQDILREVIDHIKPLSQPNVIEFDAKTYFTWSRVFPESVLRFYKDDVHETQVSDRYPLDGLIFLPALEPYPQLAWRSKFRWRNLLKWKPQHHQTTDFYLKFTSDRITFDGQTYLKAIPCTFQRGQDGEITYPPFTPTIKPITGDPNTVFIPLNDQFTLSPRTLLGEFIFDQMVVECAWLPTLGWVPTRCRYDKSQREVYGNIVAMPNAPSVAESNWLQIINPVSLDHLLGRVTPQRTTAVYYEEDAELRNLSVRLRNLHNMIKEGLIRGAVRVAQLGAPQGKRRFLLLDLATGRLGDLHKWGKAGITHVLGVDNSEFNFTQEGGAIERLKKTRGPDVPQVWLAVADMAKPLDNGEAALNEESRRQLFQTYREIGGLNQFNLVTCQFAIHYACQNESQIRNVLRNVSRNLMVGGVFAGTAFDGALLYKLLSESPQGKLEASEEIKDVGKKITWYIQRDYPTSQSFQPLGQRILVYNPWINSEPLPEYLVNFTYLTKLAKEYGLSPLNRDHSEFFDFIDPARPHFDQITLDFQQRVIPESVRQQYIGRQNTLFRDLAGRPYQEVYPAEGTYSALNRVFMFIKDTNIIVP